VFLIGYYHFLSSYQNHQLLNELIKKNIWKVGHILANKLASIKKKWSNKFPVFKIKLLSVLPPSLFYLAVTTLCDRYLVFSKLISYSSSSIMIYFWPNHLKCLSHLSEEHSFHWRKDEICIFQQLRIILHVALPHPSVTLY